MKLTSDLRQLVIAAGIAYSWTWTQIWNSNKRLELKEVFCLLWSLPVLRIASLEDGSSRYILKYISVYWRYYLKRKALTTGKSLASVLKFFPCCIWPYLFNIKFFEIISGRTKLLRCFFGRGVYAASRSPYENDMTTGQFRPKDLTNSLFLIR
jgi:hypothetical protein